MPAFTPAEIAPVLRRRVLESAWSRYTGAKVVDATRELERSQFLPELVLRGRQWVAFRDLLRFVCNHNTFYRTRFEGAGVSPAAIRSWEDFARIPILRKSDVRAAGRSMLSDGFDPDRLMKAKTGGSTGKPIELYFTEEVSQLRNASGRRNRRWAGWEVGEAVGAVWGNPVFPVTIRDRIREWVLAPTIYLDTMRITNEAVWQFARDWQRVRPTLLFGHAHSLFVVASCVERLGMSGIRPRAIVPTSMMLLPHERRVIERVFERTVTDIYGCEEVGLIAGECERHEGLHINVDQLIVEVLREDGSAAGPGETGAVVVTDLLNRAMPFIRYHMEDLAEVAMRPCSCGRGMPTLSRIIGRTADFLRRIDGSRVAGISLIENSLTRIPGIEQMQIVQEHLRQITLKVVPGVDFTSSTRDELLRYFEETFPGATVAFERVEMIPSEPNGKYRFSICRIVD